ncbi:MAG: chemotaxis protein, partial [Desulfovibrio sp.]
MSLQQKIWGLGLLALAASLGIVWCVGLLSGASMAALWGAAVGGFIVLLVMGVSLRLIYGAALQSLVLCLRGGCEPKTAGQASCCSPQAAPADLRDLYAAAADISARACHSSGVLHGILSGMPLAYLLVDVNEQATHTNQECLDMLEIDGPVKDCIGK